jgi:hypothetical protein
MSAKPVKPRTKSRIISKWKNAKLSPEMQARMNAFCQPMLEMIADERKTTAIVDPTGIHKMLASVVGELLFGKPCEEDRAWMGEYLLQGIEDLSPEELEKEFDTIVSMKRKAIKARANEGHKNATFANLLVRFKKITGRMPHSLVEFWGYVKEKGVEFPKNRTRINKQIGIAHLPHRHRKKE